MTSAVCAIPKDFDDPDIRERLGDAGSLPVSKLACVTLLRESGRSKKTGKSTGSADVPRIGSGSVVRRAGALTTAGGRRI